MAYLFAVKPLYTILQKTVDPQHSLRRFLGPVQITLLGIGANFGTGIFVTIGTTAAGDLKRPAVEPSLIISFVLVSLVYMVVTLCYAEFASLILISDSTYTYSYPTLGEIIAWIIGWDLIIEYAVGNVTVAISRADHFKTILSEAGINIPAWLSTDFQTAVRIPGLLEQSVHILGILSKLIHLNCLWIQ